MSCDHDAVSRWILHKNKNAADVHDAVSASLHVVCVHQTSGAAGRTSSPDPVTDLQLSKVTQCVLNELKAKDAARARAGSVFWPYFWRAKLCTCTDCKRMYVKTGVPFLLDKSDTLLAHEEKAKAEALTSEDLLLSCISSLNHMQQLEIIHQYNELKHELHEFLQQSADQRKDITPEAFREFLEELQTRKRRRLN
ncbi:putative E3 ubiquitin-protein ligase UBR7 [Carassius carassius]|uniref:putative E3 ubiquitin-protein ligase UBR7 n=1 Tax=Carassius carassius TaxID=217509 RepID=UPI0028692D9D|nr:putative E3 ubiquitin-protein ligase UBR7 [Carassius carassius]